MIARPRGMPDLDTNKPASNLPVIVTLAALGGLAALAGGTGRSRRVRNYAVLSGLMLAGVASHGAIANALRTAGTRRRGARLRFSFVLDRRVEEVFAFYANFENFPRFIGGLREVRDTGDGRSRWCATTPAGDTLAWQAVTTKFVTNSVIAWRSVRGAPVETVGMIRVSPEGSSTRVAVAMDYSVLEGNLRDALAAFATRPTGSALERDFRALESRADIGVADAPAGLTAVTP